MQISEILSPNRILCDGNNSSKKSALESLSALIASADPQITQAEVFESLLARERLGSTGLGEGIALPHGRLKSGERTIAAFLRTQNGIDYDAADRQPVDLLFALLVPENSTEEHLQVLSKLAEMFSNEEFRQRLRTEDSSDAIYSLFAADV